MYPRESADSLFSPSGRKLRQKENKEMKGELYQFWSMTCSEQNRDELIVEKNIWDGNVFINERFSGRGSEAKLFYEVIDPSNMESWLIFNREQNPFSGLELHLDIPNRRYSEIAGARVRRKSEHGVHLKMKK